MKYHTHVYFKTKQNKRKRKLFVKYGYFEIVVYFMSVFYFVDSLKHLAEKKYEVTVHINTFANIKVQNYIT